MNLKQFLESNKIKKDRFIAVHNKDDCWIQCDTIESHQLEDYMPIEVLDSRELGSVMIVILDYADTKSVAERQIESERLAMSHVSRKQKK